MKFFKKRKTIKELEIQIRSEITKEVKELYNKQIQELEKDYTKQVKEQKEFYKNEYHSKVKALRKENTIEIKNLTDEYKKETEELKSRHKEEIERMDKVSEDRLNILRNNHLRKLSLVEEEKELKVEEYKFRESQYKKIVKNTQRAWQKMLDVHPQILALISMLRGQSELKAIEAGRDQAKYSTMLNESEIIDRKLEKLEPVMDRLLHIDDNLKGDINE
jgi:hypothetical protein